MLCSIRNMTAPANIKDIFDSSFIYVAVMTHSLSFHIHPSKAIFHSLLSSPPRKEQQISLLPSSLYLGLLYKPHEKCQIHTSFIPSNVLL